MGLLGKIVDGINRADSAKTSAEIWIFHDRRYSRAEKLAAEGVTNEAVITGIKGRHQDDRTDYTLRLEWFDPSPRVGAVHYGGDIPVALRLGSTVRVATDGDKVAIDPGPMQGVKGAPQDAGATSRKVPEQGIDDKAFNSSVIKRWRNWPAETATVESLEVVTVLGMTSENWHITVRRTDGSTALVKRDFVPPYARWYVAPGAEVPIVVDPKDPGRAQIVYPQLAIDRSGAGGSWSDQAPAGSIAEHRIARTPDPEDISDVHSMAAPEPVDLTPSSDSVDAIEGVTLERWAEIEAALQVGRVPPAEYDAWATEQFGVPAGRWTAIQQQWQSRTTTDWRVGAAFGEAFEQARKAAKKR